MKNKKLQINLNTLPYHIYYPGDLVSGRVTIDSLLAKQEPDLKLTLFGIASVRFVKGNGRNRQVCKGREKILEICQEINTVAYKTEYPFTIQIPKPIRPLPWTTKSSLGKVEYGLEVKLKTTENCFALKFSDSSVKTEFILNSYVSKETICLSNKYFQDVQLENTVSQNIGTGGFLLCCSNFSSESIKVGIKLEHETGWYRQGDLVHFELYIDNSESNRDIENIKVRLVEVRNQIENLHEYFQKF